MRFLLATVFLLSINSLALASPPCSAPASGVEVARIAPGEWHVCALSPSGRAVRWVVTSEHNPTPEQRPAAVGRDVAGLREVYVNEALVIECGNCDVIESVRLGPGQPTVWNGRAYGSGGDPLVLGAGSWDGDRVTWHGVEQVADGAVLGPDELTSGSPPLVVSSFAIRQVGVGYAPDGPVETASRRYPISTRSIEIAIDAQGLAYDAEVVSIHNHELLIAYDGRLAAISTCDGGPIDSIRSGAGPDWTLSACSGTSNDYTPSRPAEPWVELYASADPTLAIRIETPAPTPWICLHNVAYDRKVKCYGRPVSAWTKPIPSPVGQIRRYGHRVSVR